MKKRVKIKAVVIATAIINEDVQGNQDVDEIDDIRDIQEFEVIEEL